MDRQEITLQMCERVKTNPADRVLQENGRTTYWGYVAEKERYLKVIVEPNGEEITPTHWDRGFRRRMRLTLREDLEVYESEEVSPGVVLDFTRNGQLVSIEFYDRASEKVDVSILAAESVPVVARATDRAS